MKIRSSLVWLLLSLAAFAGPPRAHAGELVPVAPHRADVWQTNSQETPPLQGFLARPDGPGQFPAVVLLHWCSGFGDHDTKAATLLKSWGYVALALDSLGDANMCERGNGAAAETFDAYAGLRYLSAQNFVASDRIAIMVWSMGGLAVLMAVDQGGIERAEQRRFRAAIAWYPPCQWVTGTLTAPTLILIGEHDDWSLADACRKLAAHASDIGITRAAGTGAPLDLVVYPDATHAFDAPFPPRRYLGHFMRYDETATRDAEARVRAFLKRELGDQPVLP